MSCEFERNASASTGWSTLALIISVSLVAVVQLLFSALEVPALVAYLGAFSSGLGLYFWMVCRASAKRH